MDRDSVNEYGDRKQVLAQGRGIDVASQREDDLDRMASDRVREIAALRKPFAIDAACGAGGQAIRMAKAGARVLAFDIAPLKAAFDSAKADAETLSSPLEAEFLRWDMRVLPASPRGSLEGQADVLVCQRAIHYLPLDEALKAIAGMGKCLAPGGRLHLSASGMGSELSEGYSAKDKPLAARFARLSEAMREKHGILDPVCLYSPKELEGLLAAAGLVAEIVFESPFGNVKAVARRPE